MGSLACPVTLPQAKLLSRKLASTKLMSARMSRPVSELASPVMRRLATVRLKLRSAPMATPGTTMAVPTGARAPVVRGVRLPSSAMMSSVASGWKVKV